MKLRQISFKIISMIMVFAMMFGMSATTISALTWHHADHTHENGKDKITYVSIGDSMTNGYGLEGYDGMSGIVNYAKDSYANKFAALLAGYTGEIKDDQVIFEGTNGIVDHRQLAMSGMRAEDLNWVLNLDYTDAAKFEAISMWYFQQQMFRGTQWEKNFAWDSNVVNYKDLWYTDGIVHTNGAGDVPGWGFNAGDKKTYDVFADGGHRYADGAAKILATYFGENGNGKGYYNSFLESDSRFQKYVTNAVNGLAANENFPEYNENRWANDGWDPSEDGSAAKIGRYRYFQIATEFYQESIKDADIITLALGNTNFGTHMLNDILAVSTVGITDGNVEKAIQNVKNVIKYFDIEKVYELAHFETEDEEEIRELIANCQEIIAEQVTSLATDKNEELQAAKTEAIQYIVTYYILSFIVNYEDVVEYILTVNPDVEIIQVGLVNAYASSKETTEATIGDLADKIYGPLNVFLAALPTYRQAEGNELYEDATFYFANSGSVDVLVDEFGADFYKKDGEFVDYNGPLALEDNTGYTANKSVIRDRMFKFINAGGGLLYKLAVGVNQATGIDFTNIDLDMVQRYDMMTAAEKAQVYASGNADLIKVANTCALYLAIEYAITVAGQEPATLSSLGKLSDEAGAFANVAGKFGAKTAGMNNTEIALAMPNVLSDIMINDADVSALFCVYARIKIGDGIGGHATSAGHYEIFDAVMDAYFQGHTAQDELLNSLTDAKLMSEAAALLLAYVKENYKEIYADVYADLEAEGYIDLANEYIDLSIEALQKLSEELPKLDVPADYEESKALLKTEIELTIVTLYHIKDILTHSEHDDAIPDFKLLLNNLEDHYDNLYALSAEFGGEFGKDARAQLKIAKENLNALATEMIDRANDYIVANLPYAYDAFVKVVVFAAKTYGPVAAEYVYNWLINNPDKVVAFFNTYGDEAVNFFKDYGYIALGVVGFVAINYGPEVLDFVLTNADVVLPNVSGWFKIHGDNAWTITKLYLNLVVEFKNGDVAIDFTSIETITASFNKIATLLGQLGKDAYGTALAIVDEIKAEIAKLDLYLNNLVDKTTADVKATLKNLLNFVNDTVETIVDNSVSGEFIPEKESTLVSISGGNAGYAELLKNYIEGKYPNDPYTVTLKDMTWDSIDYDVLKGADLVTIGFDEKQLSGFAIEQMLGYVEDYIDGTVRSETNTFANALIAVMLDNLVAKNEELKFVLGDYEKEMAQDWAQSLINSTVDAIVGKGEAPEELELSTEELAVLEIVSYAINGKDYVELDWASLVGENNVQYVDMALEAIKEQILANGIDEAFVLEYGLVNKETHEAVIELFENIIDEIGAVGTSLAELEETLAIIKDYEQFKTLFGAYATYTIEIPVVDAVLAVAESYLYNNLKFQVEYGKLIVDLYEINPDATILLLGHYNPFDVALTLGDQTIDLSEAYAYVAGVSSLQPYTYALLGENVIYIDIYDAETNFDTVADDENNLITFLVQYLNGQNPTDLSLAGQRYVFEQIVKSLEIGCAHWYDNACDTDCNRCGAERVTAHVYDNACDTTCNVCNAEREVAGHQYNENGECIHCGHIRPTTPVRPNFPTTEPDPECLKGNHYYDDCADETCYKCNEVREAPGHDFNCEGECANCDATTTAPGHVYAYACSTKCDACGAANPNAVAHQGINCNDTTCRYCDATITAGKHSFGDWIVKTEATRDNNGYEYHTCKLCGLYEVKVIKALGGLSGGAIAGIVIASVVVAGAAGFAIYWFLIQKKTFEALIEAVKALAAKLSNPEAPVAEGATAEAEAPATEEETK